MQAPPIARAVVVIGSATQPVTVVIVLVLVRAYIRVAYTVWVENRQVAR